MAEGFSFTDRQMPQLYEDLLVPRLFEPWSRLLLDLVKPQLGEALLDVATGTGVVARQAARMVGAQGKVTACDASSQMLMIGRNRTSFGGQARVDWTDSPAEALKVPDAAFDIVTCQQGAQFFTDRPKAFAEMKRAMKKNGRLAVAVWTSVDRNPIFGAIVAALTDAAGAQLGDLLKVPFSWGDAKDIEKTIRGAGFQNVEVKEHSLELEFEGGIDQATTVVQATPIGPHFAALPDAKKQAYAAAAKKRLAPHTQSKIVRGPMVSLIATARA